MELLSKDVQRAKSVLRWLSRLKMQIECLIKLTEILKDTVQSDDRRELFLKLRTAYSFHEKLLIVLSAEEGTGQLLALRHHILSQLEALGDLDNDKVSQNDWNDAVSVLEVLFQTLRFFQIEKSLFYEQSVDWAVTREMHEQAEQFDCLFNRGGFRERP